MQGLSVALCSRKPREQPGADNYQRELGLGQAAFFLTQNTAFSPDENLRWDFGITELDRSVLYSNPKIFRIHAFTAETDSWQAGTGTGWSRGCWGDDDSNALWEFLFNPASLAWSCTPQYSHTEMNQSCLVCLSNQHSWGQIKILHEADGAVQP